MYDLVVIGARASGSSVALLAARAGLRVLLVDRATFPSDTLSTNYIHQPGCARLAEWGVLDKVIASGCPPISRTRMEADGIVIEGSASGFRGQKLAYAPRRYVLDTALAEAAQQAGVEFRMRTSVTDLLWKDGRVVGVTLEREGGSSDVYSSLVVGADGMNSTVARLAKSPMTVEHPRATCAYYSFWAGLDAGYELYSGPGAWVGAVPTNGSVLVATYFSQAEFPALQRDPMRVHQDAIKKNAPALFDRLASAQQVDRLWGTGNQKNFFRRAYGPGWALVGDAGHHKDSIAARGITDALVQAELLIARVAQHISDPEALERALGRFEQDRDSLMLPGYHATLRLATLQGLEARAPTMRMIAGDQGLTTLYFDVVAGILPYSALEGALKAAAREKILEPVAG